MKVSVIDIGSNSVRLMVMADGITLYKRIITTRLGENLAKTGEISKNAILRTVKAVKELYLEGLEKSGRCFAFATAAARTGKNGAEFTKAVFDACGLTVDVISGELEARLGLSGALKKENGAVIDIGGASTEIIVQNNGQVVFSKSAQVGSVSLCDLCGQDKTKLEKVINEKIHSYGDNLKNLVSKQNIKCKVLGIGGTATNIASIDLKLNVYDPQKINGHILKTENVKSISDTLLSMTIEEREKVTGMDIRRADVIGGASLLLYKIMKFLNLKHIIISESDNLEGYVYTVLHEEI